MFWGDSPIAKKIFKLQKRVIRIIANKSQQDSYRYLFTYLNILTLPSQYIFSVFVIVFIVRSLDLYKAKSPLDIELVNG